jgi:hypothetical protein
MRTFGKVGSMSDLGPNNAAGRNEQWVGSVETDLSRDKDLLMEQILENRKRVSEEMPKRIEKARIALIATPLEITKTQVKSKIKITSPDQLVASIPRRGMPSGRWPIRS